jgi:hypothetical protein
MRIKIILILALAVCSVTVNGQTGGTFSIKEKAVSSGGGVVDDATNTIQITGIIAQPIAASQSTNGQFGVSGGFFSGNLLPLAAAVSIAGRVRGGRGQGLKTALVTVTDQAGISLTTTTGSRGNFVIEGLEAGRTYVVSVTSRRYIFAPQIITLSDNLTGMDFIGQ